MYDPNYRTLWKTINYEYSRKIRGFQGSREMGGVGRAWDFKTKKLLYIL